MNIIKEKRIKDFTSMRVGGLAAEYLDVHSSDDIIRAIKYAKIKNIPFYIVGGGSNLIGKDEGFAGLIIHMNIKGVLQVGPTRFKVAAGENWDEFVAKTVDMGLSGLEFLSSIPGSVGAAPVQNIGAYGAEVKDSIEGVEVFDVQSESIRMLANHDCHFSYRNSIFRENLNKYVILNVIFSLKTSMPQQPFYKDVTNYLDKHNLKSYTLKDLRNAVIDIRRDKLPNPKLLPNSGSFFKNPVIDERLFSSLQQSYPDIPNFPNETGKVKIPAGWLIDKAGLKGKSFYGYKIHDNNALVLINAENSTYQNLAKIRELIVSTVKNKFGVVLEQEPLELSIK